jgi:zinc protease
MFKGTPKHAGSEFFQIIAQNGGQQNAFTTRDYTAYYQMLAADKLALSFELEADRMQNLSLKADNFNSEHQVVKEERQLRTTNDPQALAFERFNAVALPANPYQNPTVGWPSDLNHLTAQDARYWYKHWYGPNNATVVVVGDVQPDEVYQLAQKTFGQVKPIELLSVKPQAMLDPLGPRKITVKLPAKLPYFILGFNTPSVVTADEKWEAYALEILAGLLGGSNSSRLQQKLVRDKQIANEVGVSYDSYTRLPGLLLIGATPAQKHTVNDVRDSIFAEIKQLKKYPVSDKELERIKTQIIANNIFSQDSIEYEAYMIGSMESIGLSWKEIDNYEKQIRKITPAQVQAVANKYLSRQNSTIGVLEPLPTTKDIPSTMPVMRGAPNVQ